MTMMYADPYHYLNCYSKIQRLHQIIVICHVNITYLTMIGKGVFKGGGFRGFKPPPPPEIFRFFLKSEGKEIERKRKKGMLGGGGGVILLIYFWG